MKRETACNASCLYRENNTKRVSLKETVKFQTLESPRAPVEESVVVLNPMAPVVPFPSPLELTVASALLLLSSNEQQPPPPPPPPQSSPQFDTDGELLLKSKSNCDEESVNLSLASSTSGSKRSASSLTSDDSSSHEIRAHKLRIIAVVARCHEMKLNVQRKNRSKTIGKLTAEKPPPPPVKTVSSGSLSTEAGSCLSSSTSAVTSAGSPLVSRSERKKGKMAREKARRKIGGGSTHIQRRADAILKLLCSSGCSSEMKIRRVLGDSPDTSKALRMLLKLEEVKRSGTGGRQDPYIYALA